MKPVSEQESHKEQKLPVFDLIVEIYDWLLIVAAALIIGLIIGCIVYFSKPDKTRLIWGIAILGTALIVGIILATNVWKQKGISLFRTRTKTSSAFKKQGEPN